MTIEWVLLKLGGELVLLSGIALFYKNTDYFRKHFSTLLYNKQP